MKKKALKWRNSINSSISSFNVLNLLQSPFLNSQVFINKMESTMKISSSITFPINSTPKLHEYNKVLYWSAVSNGSYSISKISDIFSNGSASHGVSSISSSFFIFCMYIPIQLFRNFLIDKL